MNSITKCICIGLLIVLLPLSLQSQTTTLYKYAATDSLKDKTYEQLYASFYYNISNEKLYGLYAKEFIKKAYREQDTVNIARGYYIITSEEKDKYFKYADSVLKYGNLIKSDYLYWHAYHVKGRYFFKKRKFKECFKNHIKAYKIAEEKGNAEFKNISTVNIGLIKERIGKQEEALDDFRKSYKYAYSLVKHKSKDSISHDEGVSFLKAMNRLANSYRLSKMMDSAAYMNQQIQKYRFLPKGKFYNDIACLSAAEIAFDTQEYMHAIDSVNRVLPELLAINEIKNAAIAFHIRGMAKIYTKQQKEGIHDLTRMDSIFTIQEDLYPSLRSGYTALIKHYEQQEALDSQLYYVNQLIKFDSIIHHNYAYISEGFVKELDKPQLIARKKAVEYKIHNTKSNRLVLITIAIIILSLIIIAVYSKRKVLLRKQQEEKELHSYYQQKFDALVLEHNLSYESKTAKASFPTEEGPKEIDIATDVVKNVLTSLAIFENKKLYIHSNITAHSLAQDMDTNANYLGRIIKYHYHKSFKTYINDLRINLALEKMRNEKSFKNYSIQAMAREVGFKNAEPFSKAFKEKMGVNPSDFVVKLKNNN